MRRLLALVTGLVLVPASMASATELEELLERGREVSYSAEQVITCDTPDGLRDAVIRIAQDKGDILVTSGAGGLVEILAGSGSWSLQRGGDPVTSASVSAGEEEAEPLYTVREEPGVFPVLGREITTYVLVRGDVMRAALVVDDETGAIMGSVTFLADGSVYCQRRPVSFDPSVPEFTRAVAEGDPIEDLQAESDLPETIEGFQRLDVYADPDGTTFAYYSDGFFSFAVFETPTPVSLPDSVEVDIGGSVYERSFTAGQATYVWELRHGGMALVGDLPPDLHEAVLASLPESDEPGLFRRLWRSLFG